MKITWSLYALAGVLGIAPITGCSSSSSSGSSSTSTATTITLSSSSTSTTAGTSITLTATATPSAATGTVTFYNGTVSLGSATLSGGEAALTTSFSTAGSYSLTASYGGSSSYAACASNAVSVTVTSSAGSSNIAITGMVVSVDTAHGTFAMSTSSGDITVDTTSGGTAFLEISNTTVSTSAAVGGYVGAFGTVTNDVLEASQLAFVPAPPASLVANGDLATSYVEQISTGWVYAGQITSIAGGVLNVSTSSGTVQIDPSNATTITLTSDRSIDDLTIGETVTVNGPEVSSTEYTGHMVVIGTISPPMFLPSMF